MKYAVLSDIHGNLPALEAVLAVLSEYSIDRFVVLGDIIGYGAFPDECVEVVRSLDPITVMGNHESAAINYSRFVALREDVGLALTWTSKRLSKSNRSWLSKLPMSREIDGMFLCHGAPPDPEEFAYLHDLNEARRLFSSTAELAPLTIIGHSHLTKAWRDVKGGIREHVSGRIPLDPEHRTIITAGSVGQPRDRDFRSACLMVDTDNAVAWHIRVTYNIFGAARAIIKAGLPEIFAQRLFYGI